MKALFLIQSYFLPLLVVFFIQPSYADIYKKVDAKGQVFFTDKPSGAGYKLIFKTPKKGTIAYKKFSENRRRHLPMIREQARLYNVDPALVMAIIHAESGYDAKAISKAGAVGLMQLMPATAKRYGVKNRENPLQNTAGGSQYLRYLLALFDFDIKLTLAAYNAGENAVKKYGNKIPPYPETQTYVKRVLANYLSYLKDNKFL